MNISNVGSAIPLVQPTPPSAPANAPAPASPPPTAERGEAAAAIHRPDGTDPVLWSVLTADEQAYFARQSQLGPLTYGPSNTATGTDAPRGQRIDVRA